jgi:hypothetical protein
MKINEILAEKRDKYCSDKCCGSDVKAEDCKCPPTCKHCNCNAVSETATSGGSSAGGIATSMGSGNGFANGGPGTLTRAGTVTKKKKTNKKKR